MPDAAEAYHVQHHVDPLRGNGIVGGKPEQMVTDGAARAHDRNRSHPRRCADRRLPRHWMCVAEAPRKQLRQSRSDSRGSLRRLRSPGAGEDRTRPSTCIRSTADDEAAGHPNEWARTFGRWATLGGPTRWRTTTSIPRARGETVVTTDNVLMSFTAAVGSLGAEQVQQVLSIAGRAPAVHGTRPWRFCCYAAWS